MIFKSYFYKKGQEDGLTKKNCFVIMPFGEKIDVGGEIINFNDVYEFIIKDVVENRLALNCIRSDEITQAGWVHRDMLEHIIQDDVVVVDITTLNPNVFHELGVRHALRKFVTVLIKKSDKDTIQHPWVEDDRI